MYFPYFEMKLQVMYHNFHVFVKYVKTFYMKIMPLEAIPRSQCQQYQSGDYTSVQDGSSSVMIAC
jgi:hypothetical protein